MRAAFARLPPELQETIALTEGERDRAVSRAQQEAGDARRRAEQEAGEIGQFKGALDQLIRRGQATFRDRWADFDQNLPALVDQFGAEQALKWRAERDVEQAELARPPPATGPPPPTRPNRSRSRPISRPLPRRLHDYPGGSTRCADIDRRWLRFPASVVSLLDAGAAGLQLPAAPSVADDAPSTFRLSDLAENALRNDAAKRANDAQLLDLRPGLFPSRRSGTSRGCPPSRDAAIKPEWVAVWVAAAALLVGLVVQALVIAFHFGRHAARLSMMEQASKDASASAGVLAALTATVHALKEQVGALDHTIRNILMQRMAEGRKAGEG